MDRKKLGTKYACFKCSCKFYDLNRPQALCPKCGADQNEAPKKAHHEVHHLSASHSQRSRIKKKIEEEFIEEEPLGTDEGDNIAKELEDGFSLLPEDEEEEDFGIDEDED